MPQSSNCRWSYFNPVKVIFGNGSLTELPSLVKGRRVLLVTSAGFTNRGVTDQVVGLLGIDRVYVLDNVRPTPEIRKLENDCELLAREEFDVVIGLGGGSSIDTAKALSYALCCGRKNLRDWFESSQPSTTVDALPVLAIPTTAGTGSEVTPYATIWEKQREKKYSLASPRLIPQTALLDPELTLSLPQEITVATGLDALSQGLDAIWNKNATPVTTAYAMEAVDIAMETLPRLKDSLDNIGARTKMMEASMLAGLAISNSQTALAHSISYPLTARYAMPHGLACSFMLPAILEFNFSTAAGPIERLMECLGYASLSAFKDKLLNFLVALEVGEGLQRYVTNLDNLLELTPKMITSERAGNNIRPASVEDVYALLITSWQDLVG